MTQPPKPQPIRHEPDDTKWLALTIRRGLLVIVRAIEERYDVGSCEKAKRVA